jgi:hypothetical protein
MSRLRMSRLSLLGTLLLILGPTFPHPGYGWAQVEKQKDVVTLTVRDASITEVLAALGARLRLRIDASWGLDEVVSGTYQGSLQQVIGRLLVGYDYVTKYSEEAVDIIVLGSSQPAQPASAVDQTLPPAGSARHQRRSRKEQMVVARCAGGTALNYSRSGFCGL